MVAVKYVVAALLSTNHECFTAFLKQQKSASSQCVHFGNKLRRDNVNGRRKATELVTRQVRMRLSKEGYKAIFFGKLIINSDAGGRTMGVGKDIGRNS